ncbi:MAG: ATPase component of energizing module of predicted pantothenate ECF transporter, partial [uncultured Rubrobacteraceae bacterium]
DRDRGPLLLLPHGRGGRGASSARPGPARGTGAVRRDHRPQRLGQEHARQTAHGHPVPDGGRDPDRRRPRERGKPVGGSAQGLRRLPRPRRPTRHEPGRGRRGLRAREPGVTAGGDRGEGRVVARRARAHGDPGAPDRGPLLGPEAAGRDSRGTGDAPAVPDPGRANLAPPRPGRDAPGVHDQGLQPPRGHGGPARHPLDARGLALRPGRGDGLGAQDPGRYPRGGLPPRRAPAGGRPGRPPGREPRPPPARPRNPSGGRRPGRGGSAGRPLCRHRGSRRPPGM